MTLRLEDGPLDQKIGRASTSYQRLVESIQDLTLLGQQGVLMRPLWCPVSTVQFEAEQMLVSENIFTFWVPKSFYNTL